MFNSIWSLFAYTQFPKSAAPLCISDHRQELLSFLLIFIYAADVRSHFGYFLKDKHKHVSASACLMAQKGFQWHFHVTVILA